MPITSWSSAHRWALTLAPITPAAPVTNYFIVNLVFFSRARIDPEYKLCLRAHQAFD